MYEISMKQITHLSHIELDRCTKDKPSPRNNNY